MTWRLALRDASRNRARTLSSQIACLSLVALVACGAAVLTMQEASDRQFGYTAQQRAGMGFIHVSEAPATGLGAWTRPIGAAVGGALGRPVLTAPVSGILEKRSMYGFGPSPSSLNPVRSADSCQSATLVTGGRGRLTGC